MDDPLCWQSRSRTYDFDVHAEVQEKSDKDQINFKCNLNILRVYFLKLLFALKLLPLICKLFFTYTLNVRFYLPKLITLLRIYHNRDTLKLISDDLKFNHSKNALADCIKFSNKTPMFKIDRCSYLCKCYLLKWILLSKGHIYLSSASWWFWNWKQ